MATKAPPRRRRARDARPAATTRTTMIGRDAELATLARLFGVVGARLVTISGPPGIGKSRLAREYVAASRPAARVCDLADARGAGDVFDLVGAALALRAPSHAEALDPVDRIGRALADRGGLLVLDNFEHLVECASEPVTRWLALAPDARVLVTSRERLRVDTEHVCELAPLGLPDASVAPADADAVRLLVERARAIVPDFAVTAANATTLGQIVTRLDGIPLAIELATARLSTLDPAALLERLAQRFELLGLGARGASARQRTMRAAVDWSWTLLAPHEQTALSQCALFRGGFTVEALERVVDLTDHAGAPPVLDAVQSLRDKSLVYRDGPARLAMLATIREYAAERLRDAPATARARLRHAACFVERAEAAASIGAGAAGARAVPRAERGNVLAALEAALAEAPPTAHGAALALRGLLALAATDGAGLTIARQLALLDAALARATDAGLDDASLRARALTIRGRYRNVSGQLAAGTADHAAALAAAQGAGATAVEAFVRYEIGDAYAFQGRFADAAAQLAQARELYRRAQDRRGELGALWRISAAVIGAGDLDGGRVRAEEALALAREMGDAETARLALQALGLVALERDDGASARRHYEAAWELSRASASATVFHVDASLATLDLAAGHPAAALARYVPALEAARAVGHGRLEGLYLLYIALTLRELGRPAEAVDRLRLATRVLRSVDSRRHEAQAHGALGGLLATLGDDAGAARAFASADALLADAPGATQVTVDLERGHADLGATDAVRRAAGLASARARVARATTPQGGREAWSARSLDVRLALRVLARALAAAERDAPAPRPTLDARPAVRVHARGHWFQLPGGDRVACTGRDAIRRLLVRLAEQRLNAPGIPVLPAALVQAGWPDERIQPGAARNRLHVALAALRKLGLRALLLREQGGYLLDTHVPLRFDDPSQP